MSGYLEVKYPLKSNIGLNPFKSWKRQWCILRPSPTCSGGSLAVYCSEAGAVAGSVELPLGCVVRRAKSRTRPYAFAVFPSDEPRKPRILLAAQSLHDAHAWMDKIRELLNGDKLLGTELLLKDSYSVTVGAGELSRACGLSAADCILTLSSSGVLVSRLQKLGTFLPWKHIRDVLLITENSGDRSKICVLNVDSEFAHGGGELKLATPQAGELAAAARQAWRDCCGVRCGKLSRSEGDLRAGSDGETGAADVRRSSWYSGPSEVSLDDIDLVMSKEARRTPLGQLSRCSGEGDLAPAAARARLQSCPAQSGASCADSISDRRSLLSVASGIYEEIPDLPEPAEYCAMAPRDEPTYESVAECVYATMRRVGKRQPPPPLPPRLPFGTMKLGESWNSRMNNSPADSNVTRHSSLGSLPRCCSVSSGSSAHTEPGSTRTLPSKSRQPFSVFRKRLKSDSRIATSPKSDTSKENKDVETKKKKFDFTPTRDIFRNFKVGRKMKGLKINTGALAKGETKSCEFLDDSTERIAAHRCSKSVECLEGNDEFLDEFDADLSIEFNDDAVAALALPQEIVELILRGREQLSKIRLKGAQLESEYMTMSPIAPPPPPIEHHYIVMSPKTNLA